MAENGGNPSLQNCRLLIAGLTWPPETFLARLIRGLLNTGLHITVATSRKPGQTWLSHPNLIWLPTPNWEGPIAKRFFHLSKMIMEGAMHSFTDLRKFAVQINNKNSLGNSLRAWFRLLPFAGRRWDVIYLPWNSAAINYLQLFDLGMPVVFSCRGSQVNVAPHNPQRASIRDGLRKTFKKTTAVHCVSQAILQEATRYGLDPSKAVVIRPAVDPYFFRPPERQPQIDGTYRVITTGSLIWRKGYEYALQAIRKLKDASIPLHFDIIGDGPERQRVLYTIHDLELEKEVQLHGCLPPVKVRDLLQQADVFLLSSLSEGISNAVLEAMACGLPVVTTDCGGMREAVTDGVEGFVVPVRDVDAMATALQRLWRNPDLLRLMSEAGRERVVKNFTLEKQLCSFLKLYQSVVETRRI